MELSEAARLFLSLCWKDGVGVGVNPWFKHTYTINKQECKFTEEVFQEIKLSNLVKVLFESEKTVSFCGIGENPL
jgi:hypothetical protein